MYKLAVYGGSFNPPHSGHTLAIIEASKRAERLLVVPSYEHPEGKVLLGYETRIAALRKVISAIRNNCEAEIGLSQHEYVLKLCENVYGPVYTYTLLTYFAQMYQLEPKEIAFVCGPDVKDNLPLYYKGPEVLAEFSLIAVDEIGQARSSKIRKLKADGQQIPSQWMAPGLTSEDYDKMLKFAPRMEVRHA